MEVCGFKFCGVVGDRMCPVKLGVQDASSTVMVVAVGCPGGSRKLLYGRYVKQLELGWCHQSRQRSHPLSVSWLRTHGLAIERQSCILILLPFVPAPQSQP